MDFLLLHAPQNNLLFNILQDFFCLLQLSASCRAQAAQALIVCH